MDDFYAARRGLIPPLPWPTFPPPFSEVSDELEKRQGGTTKGGVLLPWEALETRADTLTTTATAEGGNLAPPPIMSVLERFFETSAAARFGVRTLQVTGKPGFPEMIDGASIAWVGEGKGTDASAIVTTTRTPTIHTATARYLVSRQAVHQNPALQPILRRDLSEVIRSGVDRAVFQGSGLNNEPSGLDARLAGTALDAKATFSALLARAVALWESAKLSGVEGIRMAAAPIVFQTLADSTATGETSQLDRVQKTFGGAVFSPNVSTWGARNTTAKGASTVYMAAGVDHAFVTAWGSPELIVDPYSESKTGRIALTVFTFLDFLAQRTGTHFVKLTGVQDR